MPRLPRYVLPGQPQHVIQRGNNRNAIFAADADYAFYMEKLVDACRRFRCDVHAYVQMTNHVHLLMTPHTEGGIGKVMQSLGRYYVQYFNYTYSRTGTLWEGRYRATLIEGERYLLTCMRYIELNPVRAGMVDHPSRYPYSSYHANAMGREDALVTEHDLYRQLGPSPEDRQSGYRALFRSSIGKEALKDIREATNKAWVLGSDRFREQIAVLSQRRTAPLARGGDRRSEKYRQNGNINRV